jgi:hypothetical protein
VSLAFLAVAVLCVALPTSAAKVTGVAWSLGVSENHLGCGHVVASTPRSGRANTTVFWEASAASHECAGAAGTANAYSDASTAMGGWANFSHAFSSGRGGIALTWNLTFDAWVFATVPNASRCPPGASNSSTYLSAYSTWENTTYRGKVCYSFAWVGIEADAWIVDLTTGSTVYVSHAWPGELAEAGGSVDLSNVTTNYSNPSFWRYNSSVSRNTGAIGPASASLNGSYTPTLYVNGSFVASDRYLVWGQVFPYISLGAFNAPRAFQVGHFDARGAGDRLAIVSYRSW